MCSETAYPHHLGAVSWRDVPVAKGPLARLRGLLAYRTLKAALERCPLFDAAWYLKNDPALTVSGWDPLLHYCLCGVFENRNIPKSRRAA